MRDDGIVCFHISNRYLRLEPVLANIVKAIREEPNSPYPDLIGYSESDSEATRYSEDGRALYAPANLEGKASSSWVMIGRSQAVLSKLYTQQEWEKAKPGLARSLKEASCLPTSAQMGLNGQTISMILSGCLNGEFGYETRTGRRVFSGEDALIGNAPWTPLVPRAEAGVWTDDYAPILKVFNFR
jgi:hypothetical protein